MSVWQVDGRPRISSNATDGLAAKLGITVMPGERRPPTARRRACSGPSQDAVTAAGRRWFADVCGTEVSPPRARRPRVRTCLDWIERRSHLGGALGAALLWTALTVSRAGARVLGDLPAVAG